MNEQWKTFLETQGAQFGDQGVADFGDPANERRQARDGLVLCDLSHYGLIRGQGGDAQSFFQGQFSNDVAQVSPQRSQLNSYNSPKGRAYAVFRLFQDDTHWYLRLPREVLEPTLQRLKMFVLRSDVTLEDASDERIIAGLAGPGSDELLKGALGGAPADIDDVTHQDGITAIRVPGPAPRFELHGEPQAMQALWSKLAGQAKPTGGGVWEWLDIQAGLTNVFAATREEFVLQMINFQLVGGVSFTKGCYPGQEVVARMHYLGNLKKRSFIAHVDSDQAPAINDDLFSPEAGKNQSIGQVVNAQPSPDGGYDLLAVIQIAVAEEHPVHLRDAEGPVLGLRELPYPAVLEK